MGPGVEKVDSAAAASQHRKLPLPRQLRALVSFLLVAAAAATPLAAQQEAPRVVRGLSFEGNHAIDDYTLSTAIATSNSSWFARAFLIRYLGLGDKREFNELEFRRDVVRLLLLYRQSGYMNAVIDTVVRRDNGDVYVTFRISEGEPVRVTKLTVLGVDSIGSPATLARRLPLEVGAPFNRFVFQASADTLVAWLRNRGYPYADVLRSYDVDASALSAQATLEAVPGPRMRIGEVVIAGAERSDTAALRRMLSVKRGDWFRLDELYRTQRDLYGLGMFRSVNVFLADTAPGPGDSTARVLVRLAEAPPHSIRLGAGYGSLDCFRTEAGWTAYDFLGGARTLDLTGQLSKIGVGYPTDWGLSDNACRFLLNDSTSDTANYNATIALRQPSFLSPRHSASLALFAERRSEFKVYTRQDVGANLAMTFNARRAIPVTVGYSYSIGRTTATPVVYCIYFRVCNDSDQVFLANRRRFGAVTVSGVRSQVNSVLDPSAGSLIQASIAYASHYVLSESPYEFNRAELEVAEYYPLARRTVLAWRVRGGVILPQRITLSGQGARFVPPDQRFYAGGPNSVRGYRLNELGPLVYVTDSIVVQGMDTTALPSHVRASPTGGNTVFTANLELRVPTPLFPDRMRLGLYVDAGQVWERGEKLSSIRGVRVTPGIGLRFVTPLGPVRLDAAYNGYPAEPGPVYYQNNTDKSLTQLSQTFRPGLPARFWKRVTVQFAVGQAF